MSLLLFEAYGFLKTPLVDVSEDLLSPEIP